MFDSMLIDSALIRLFRFRTRGFMKMAEADGRVPPVPEGDAYLYVHIPFCEVLCPFCSFHRVQHRKAEAHAYFASLREEIQRYHAAGHRFTGVYFGGGTPTCEPEELVETIGLVRALFGVREVSVETNPKDLQPPLLESLRAAGVTRLSVGVQSFDDQLLREMERFTKYGSGSETAERIRLAAPYFPTLNVDLIFNQPHQTLESLQRDLKIFRTLGANQISMYPLMTSPTVLHRMERNMGRPDHRRLRQFYQAIVRELAPDFAPTSAWCFTKGGQGSDEYLVASENYVGVGSGAFSYLDGTLYSTSFSLQAYGERIRDGLTGITTRHRLDDTDRMRYTLLVKMFGLGLDRRWAQARYGRKFFRKLWPELRSMELLGAVTRDDRGWRLTGRGMFWLMLMMSEFFESVNTYRDAMRAHVKEELDRYAETCPALASGTCRQPVFN